MLNVKCASVSELMSHVIQSMTKTNIKTHNTKKNKNKSLNLKMFNRVLSILIIICGVYYLTCINDLSVKSFKMQEFKQVMSQLDKENSDLEVKIMSLNSYNYLNQKVAGLGMVAAGEVEYIAAAGSVAALR